MAIRKPSTKRTSTADSSAPSTAPATPRRRTGAVRRAKTTAAQPAPAATSDADQTPAEEHIRVRAYYLHLERRGHPADPVADWLRARQELSGGADTAHGSEA
ncbi:MAG TPA: DUF2934 domain-containing protein [Vicinamibacterales bacterium]|nr:DUF2934 domain-containing protein [Vicinamibacterales bacterium]